MRIPYFISPSNTQGLSRHVARIAVSYHGFEALLHPGSRNVLTAVYDTLTCMPHVVLMKITEGDCEGSFHLDRKVAQLVLSSGRHMQNVRATTLVAHVHGNPRSPPIHLS